LCTRLEMHKHLFLPFSFLFNKKEITSISHEEAGRG
jgi:hypothetical protein